jgi:hypothetical protein
MVPVRIGAVISPLAWLPDFKGALIALAVDEAEIW